LLLCAAILIAACTVMGTGRGTVTPSGEPISFNWKSTDGGITGTMSATLTDGRTFTGPFLQVRSTLRREAFAPFWVGWPTFWTDWPFPPPPIPVSEFTTRYTDRVIANLEGPGGQRMRCRFHLNEPLRGMRSGGQGECETSDGRRIDAVFPPADRT
jgi:hypothetical protein